MLISSLVLFCSFCSFSFASTRRYVVYHHGWSLFGSFLSPYSLGSPRVLTLLMSGVTIPHGQNHLIHNAFASGSPETDFYKDSHEDITAVHGTPRLTLDPLHNCTGITTIAALRDLDVRSVGISVLLKKGLPLDNGLGSSAATTVAVAFASGSPETDFYKDSHEDITDVHGTPRLTLDPLHNCTGIAAIAALRDLGVRSVGISILMEKGLPLGNGLGSSADTTVAFAGGSPETDFYKNSHEDITAVHGTPRLTLDPLHNCTGIAAIAALRDLGVRSVGISVLLEKGLPLGNGLGSSAATTVAVAFAVNALFDDLFDLVLANPFTRTQPTS